MVFFDIDGTLLNEDKELPLSTKRAVKSLKKAGHEVAIATGRAPYFFKDLLEELQIESYVCFNGQLVVYKGETIYRNSLDAEELDRLESFASKQEHPLVFMSEDGFQANAKDHPHIQESIETLKIDLPGHDPDFYKYQELCQCLLFCTEDEEQEYRRQFTKLRFVRWHPLSTDILPHDGSKANGIQQFIEKAGVSKDQVYAFGDQLNDMEMLAFAKHGVAMGNAPDVVKEKANYVTKHVNDDGIEHGLKMVGLL